MLIEERTSTHIYRQKQMLSKEELLKRESLCVHEQPAYCNAACPLKLDVKAMAAAVARGDFDHALALYEKITPFPHILSAGCEADCEEKCRLCSLGDGIAIRDLERAALRYGASSKGRGIRFQKKKTAAILGSGLFPLFLAGELAKKNYPVSIFCEEPDAMEFLAVETQFAGQENRELDLGKLQAMDLH